MLRVVLVEPHYAGNIGSIARLMKNFGLKELYLVNPLEYHLSEEAISRAMHGRDILEGAKLVNSLDEAIADMELVVGTTGNYHEKRVSRTPISPEKLSEILPSHRRVAILFGREPSGLHNHELEKCNVVVTIPTSEEYSSLNISHAAAILFYTIFRHHHYIRRRFVPRTDQWKVLDKLIDEVSLLGRWKDREEVVRALKTSVRRGILTQKEINIFIGVLSNLLREAGRSRPQKRRPKNA